MNNSRRDDTVIMRITIALLFLVFTFFYLYNYQADVLAMAQHVLSGGKTSYNALIGASLITFTLYLLQVVVNGFLQLKSRSHALTYFPSLLVLTILTDVSPNLDKGFSFGAWLWVFPLLISIWVIVVLAAKEMLPSSSPDGGQVGSLFSRTAWINVLSMFVMFFLVGLFCNSDEVFHYRMKVEKCLTERKYDEALDVGYKSLATDSSLTMLRIYALAANKELPERLFEYPLVGGSAAMKPNGTTVKMLLHTDTKLRYVRKSARDYKLCAFLLDRNLDTFAKEIVRLYGTHNLPKHYREALALYKHLRANPVVVYQDNVMDADYSDYQEMKKKYKNPIERKNRLRDAYGKTYWYYYDYGGVNVV